ncbi:MAG: UDP-N-acetylglucosamine pyrophosphorylase [Clostridiaceae bacterium]|nr:UDP-N-acetylglucosamine pyrophosphorylase [Clostridiaceae bacterium]
MIKTKDLITYQNTLVEALLAEIEYPWQVLSQIHDYILEIGPKLSIEDFKQIDDNIWIHNSVKIAKTSTIIGPTIIDENTEIRPGAFIRGNVFIGKNCVVGNSTEIKNSLLIEHVEVPHYNYVGDSILAPYSHLGAGSITSNIKADRQNIIINVNGEKIETGLRKIGAILGDHVEIGCNAVLNPGTIIGKNSHVYPLSMVRGYVPSNHIYKNKSEIVLIEDK